VPPIRKFCKDKEEENYIRGLVSKKMKTKDLAVILKCSRSTVWRILVELGVNKTRNKNGSSKNNKQYFNWNHYKNGII